MNKAPSFAGEYKVRLLYARANKILRWLAFKGTSHLGPYLAHIRFNTYLYTMNAINLTAYYKTIQKKTGKSPDDFKKLAAEKGFVVDNNLMPGVRAMEVIQWLKADYGLGQGHGLALYHSFKLEQD